MARRKHQGLTRNPAVRTTLVLIGLALIALTPIVGPIPGPGGVIVFGAGLTLVLRYSDWAKKQYVRFKKRYPKQAAWTDWGLRRRSARRREALRKAREGEPPEEARSHVEVRQVVEASRQGLGD